MEIITEPQFLSETKQKFSDREYLKILQVLKFMEENDFKTISKGRVHKLRGYYSREGNPIFSCRVTQRIRMLFTISSENSLYILDCVTHDDLLRSKF